MAQPELLVGAAEAGAIRLATTPDRCAIDVTVTPGAGRTVGYGRARLTLAPGERGAIAFGRESHGGHSVHVDVTVTAAS